jgi:predicted acetyltransferase
MHTIRLDGEFAGGGGAFPFELTVPGGLVRAGGVTVIGILPPFRRRGLLRGLMRAQFEAMHERGEHVAYLWASEDRIYGRYGYGMASQTMWIDLSRDHAGFALPPASPGGVRIVGLEEALASFPDVYERVAVRTPGMFGRTPAWWETRTLRDPPERREGGGEHVRIVYEEDGRAEGYAVYRIHAHWEDGLADGHVNVVEALGATPSATAALWRYLLDVDWMQSVRARLLPVDHELTFLLAEPRHLRARVGDGLWVRVVDVGEALRARTYADLEPVTIELADGYCPWNVGRWRVGPEGVERSAGEPDLRCDVRELGSAYLGGVSWHELVRAGRVEELVEGAAARATALFAADRAPWCPEIF